MFDVHQFLSRLNRPLFMLSPALCSLPSALRNPSNQRAAANGSVQRDQSHGHSSTGSRTSVCGPSFRSWFARANHHPNRPPSLWIGPDFGDSKLRFEGGTNFGAFNEHKPCSIDGEDAWSGGIYAHPDSDELSFKT